MGPLSVAEIAPAGTPFASILAEFQTCVEPGPRQGGVWGKNLFFAGLYRTRHITRGFLTTFSYKGFFGRRLRPSRLFLVRFQMGGFQMRGIFGGLFVFMLVWLMGLTVHAQVAVPSLVPGVPNVGDPILGIPTASFVPPNPAAMQWGEPSKWGLGQINAERRVTEPTAGTPVEFGGLFIGFRKVDKEISFGAQLLELADDTNAAREADWKSLDAGVAFQSGDNIAFGVGMNRISNTSQGDSQEFNTINLGMSIEIRRNIFAGFAIGTEDISSSFNGEDDRSVQKYGVGYRTGRAFKTHLEFYIVDRDQADNFADEFSDVASQVLVLEFNLSGFLLAASFNRTQRARLDLETTTVVGDLGWAPKNGFSLIFHIEQTSGTDSTQFAESEFESDISSISASFLF